MWFKTRVGMVQLEGTVEYLVGRFAVANNMSAIGIYAYQAHHAELQITRLFRRSIDIYNRRIYIACFPDNPISNRTITECFRRIESAVRSGEVICDLSDIGDVASWGQQEEMLFVDWGRG
jgi:hypothetical protein